MRHAQPRQYFAATQRAVANADTIEWEALPSLAWEATVAASLDSIPAATSFAEPLAGLAIREVDKPDVFRHFLAADAAGH